MLAELTELLSDVDGWSADSGLVADMQRAVVLLLRAEIARLDRKEPEYQSRMMEP